MKRQGQRTDLIYLLIEKGACSEQVRKKWTIEKRTLLM